MTTTPADFQTWVKLYEPRVVYDPKEYTSTASWVSPYWSSSTGYVSTWDSTHSNWTSDWTYVHQNNGWAYFKQNYDYSWLFPDIKNCTEDLDRLNDLLAKQELLLTELYYTPLPEFSEADLPEPEDHYTKESTQWVLKWEYARDKIIDFLKEEELYLVDLIHRTEEKQSEFQLKLLQDSLSEDGALAITLAELKRPNFEELLQGYQNILTSIQASIEVCFHRNLDSADGGPGTSVVYYT